MFKDILDTPFETHLCKMIETICNWTAEERKEEFDRLIYKVQTPFGVVNVMRDGRTEEEIRKDWNVEP